MDITVQLLGTQKSCKEQLSVSKAWPAAVNYVCVKCSIPKDKADESLKTRWLIKKFILCPLQHPKLC